MRKRRMEMGGVFENLRSIFSVFAPKEKTGLPAMVPKASAKSAFDVVRRRREEGTGLPAPLPPPPPPPPPAAPKKSMFEIFAPGPKEPPKETMFSIYAPGEKGALTRHAEKKFEMFRREPEPGETPETRQAREMVLWESLFPEEARGTGFEMYAPAGGAQEQGRRAERGVLQELGPMVPYRPPRRYKEKLREWNKQFPDIAEETQGQIPTWIAHDFGWVMPSPLEVAEQVREYMDLNLIFEDVLDIMDTPWWGEEVRESPHMGLVAAYELWTMTEEFILKMMGLPEDLYHMYGYDPLGDEYFWAEVLIPYFRRFAKAMDALKPRAIPGWFEIQMAMPKDFELVYLETPRGGLWQ